MSKTSSPAAAPAYERYAAHYDAGQLHFSILMEGYVREVLALHRPDADPGALVDLACGTGTFALMLADAGWDVLGIDASAPMLRQAQRKARGAAGSQRAIRFRRADMRDWQLSDPVDVVTCFFDSLNYLLTEEDLAAAFACAAAALKPGGLWIFDLNTPFFLEYIWQPVEIEEREGYAHVMQSAFDHATTTSHLTLTGFVRRPDGRYDRFDERHAERGYDQATIQRLLTNAGFTVEATYECFLLSPPTPTSHRWLWVARNSRPQRG